MSAFKINRIENIVSDFYSVYNNIRTVGLDFEFVKSMTINQLEELRVNENDLKNIKEIIIYLSNNLTARSKLCKMVKNEDPIWMKFYKDEYKDEELCTIVEYIETNLGTSSRKLNIFRN